MLLRGFGGYNSHGRLTGISENEEEIILSNLEIKAIVGNDNLGNGFRKLRDNFLTKARRDKEKYYLILNPEIGDCTIQYVVFNKVSSREAKH